MRGRGGAGADAAAETMMINRILHHMSVFLDWADATFAQSEGGLPAASFARPHELRDLYRHEPDGSGLLLAQASFGQLLRTVPVGSGGELGNLMVVGPPRRGKSQLLIGQILAWPHNLIVNDPKKELAKTTGTYRRLLGKAFFFDPLSPTSHQYDPLRGKHTERQLNAAATQLLYKPNEGEAEIFTQRAIKLLTLLFLAAREENKQAGFEKYHLLPYIREMMDLGGLNPIARRLHTVSPYLARLFLNGEYNPKTNYDEVKFLRDAYATLDARLWNLLTKDIVHCFNGSDFTQEDFIYSETPITLFLCWSEAELLSLAPLVRLVWDSLMNGMIHAYDTAKGKPTYPVLCPIDEAGRTEIPGLAHYASTVCGRRISLEPVFQSLSQLEATYGKPRAQEIKDNCENKLIFRPSDYETAYELSKWLGERSAFARSETEHDGETVSTGLSEREIPLMTAQQIDRMNRDEVIGRCSGYPSFKAKRFDYTKFAELVRRRDMRPPTPLGLPETSIFSRFLPSTTTV
jgi:type IV secretion system protein VirD4